MKLSTKASAVALASLWGGCMMFVGLLNALLPPYGSEFLHVMGSVYPGYGAAPTVAGVIVGTIWGISDGGVAGFLFAWLYNCFLGKGKPLAVPTQ